MRDDFAVLILTHGRPERIKTLKTLKKCGYTGKWYLILDDEDPTIEQTKNLFGVDHIVIFKKSEINVDIMDNRPEKNVVVFARNACQGIAKNLGLRYFAEFDDDYESFSFRYPKNGVLKSTTIYDIDSVFSEMISFIETVGEIQPKFETIAFLQNGDFLGVALSGSYKIKRKAMNSFFFKVEEKDKVAPKFKGRINEDVNFYVDAGMRGYLCFSFHKISVGQTPTQQDKGGLTEAYLESGTYKKSFYSVMVEPSCVKVSAMGGTYQRIQHRVQWDNCTPMIISEKYKKEEK